MIRTGTVMRQYLVAAFLIVIGLVAAGCGDTASVNPAAQLASLAVDPGSLEPAFSGGTTQYNVNLSSSITSVTITAQPAEGGDTVTINNQPTTSSVITLGAPGTTTTASISVSGSGADPRTYVVSLVRAGLTGNNSLQNLGVSPGTLAPTFEENFLSYTVDVANNVGSVTVTPTLSDPAATMTVNGQPATSGQASIVPLNAAGQDTAIPIVVTAQNSSTKRYTVTVSRGVSSNSNLQSLTISPGTLTPTFNANRASTSYTVNVASTVTSVTVTPRLQDATASMTVNGQATNSGQSRTVTLNGAGSNTIINIIATAQNGTSKPYSVNVNRAALGGNNDLRGLTVSPGQLAPAFSANTTRYAVSVDSDVTSITVTATLQDTNATMAIGGQGTRSGQGRNVGLGVPGSSTDITIVVTAPNSSQMVYTITVNKALPSSNNNLRALSVRAGTAAQTLSPTFASSTTNYTVNVGSAVTNATITATLQDTDGSMTINGQGTSSGVASAPITLGAPGSSTDIPIVVTAPNGDSKPYTITVKKRPPAPDLIPADDSGFLPGNDSDNVTNVTTPRFQIPQPGQGEIPNLYVDEGKVGSTFDQGANTLQPTTPLGDGTHSITYTVTNAASLESPQSDSLEVTINTVAPAPP